MQPPRFWQNDPRHPGFRARIFAPLAALTRHLSRRRLKNGPWNKVEVPVICVGNINIGGTGKTPTVIALAEHLKDMGHHPHVVSRGYGGTQSGPLKVDIYRHKARDVGDEPLLIAAFCPTWVARDRYAGTKAAIAQGADVILLDDGFQNPTLAKDISIVVVDAVAGFGNGRVFPAGPLREAPAQGLARADLMLLIGPAKAAQRFLSLWSQILPPSLPIVRATLKPLETGMVWKGRKFLAFAGIGRPEKFFATLRSLGAELIQTESLSDHQPLTLPLLQRMEASAFFKGAQLVTTEKDAARLPQSFKLRVVTLPVRLSLNDWEPIEAALDTVGVGRKTP